MSSRRTLALSLLLLASGCTLGPMTSPPPPRDDEIAPQEMPPPAPREFRGAWVATVANIDWPSQPGLAAAAQRREAVALLDQAQRIGLNAIVLQIRPAADALYPSALEPWSDYLSGTQGRPPEPAYDPLAFWVHEAHRRGIELHAWLNPYRARHSSARSPSAESHVARRQPQLVRSYGEMWWLDPGEPEAAAHTLAVVADVVRRYDIDGLHIDDYFYPYPVVAPEGGEQPFPDDRSYERYLSAGGTLARDDWRRENVNALIEAMHERVHRLKPGLRFGVSPFGLGRPELRPPGIEGFSQYHKLYADVERWIDKRWADYWVPQLYWAIDRAPQAFGVLLDYWRGRVGDSRHLWPGLFTSRIGNGAQPWKADELLAQIELMRQRGVSGHVHFSMVALMQDRDGIATRLRQGAYAQPALPPASPWLETQPPAAPKVAVGRNNVTLWPAADGVPFVWAVWRRVAGQWQFAVQPGALTSIAVQPRADQPAPDALVVSAVSRTGQESPRVALRLRTP